MEQTTRTEVVQSRMHIKSPFIEIQSNNASEDGRITDKLLLEAKITVTDAPTDRWTNGPLNQRADGPMDRWIDGPMDQWTRQRRDYRVVD